MSDVTQILSQIESGDPSAAEQLLPLVYEELRKLAAVRLAQEKPGQTLQATALVHEAYIRLVDAEEVQHWNSRGHFFGAAAEAMRRLLVDNFRTKKSQRRGGDADRVSLSQIEVAENSPTLDLISLNDAIDALEKDHPQAAKVVKMRYFAGLTIDEVAISLGLSHATVERYWAYARARLHAELQTTL